MKRILHVVAYLVLVAVVISCLRSVWIGLTDTVRYQSAFPGAQGLLYWCTLLVSLLAAINAILIGLRKKLAILVNPLIGIVSIMLIGVVGGARSNQTIVLVACALSTVIPWYLWVWRTLTTGRK